MSYKEEFEHKKLICLLLTLTLLGSLWACTTAPVDDMEGSEPPISQMPPETDPPVPTETDPPTDPPETDPPETEFVPPEGLLLTEAELDEFRTLFVFYPGPSWYNMALTSTYDSPENVNWSQFFYMGFDGSSGVPFRDLSEEERIFWERNGQGISVDIYRMPLDKMDAVAMEYFGLTIDESNLVGLQGAHICFFRRQTAIIFAMGTWVA